MAGWRRRSLSSAVLRTPCTPLSSSRRRTPRARACVCKKKEHKRSDTRRGCAVLVRPRPPRRRPSAGADASLGCKPLLLPLLAPVARPPTTPQRLFVPCTRDHLAYRNHRLRPEAERLRLERARVADAPRKSVLVYLARRCAILPRPPAPPSLTRGAQTSGKLPLASFGRQARSCRAARASGRGNLLLREREKELVDAARTPRLPCPRRGARAGPKQTSRSSLPQRLRRAPARRPAPARASFACASAERAHFLRLTPDADADNADATQPSSSPPKPHSHATNGAGQPVLRPRPRGAAAAAGAAAGGQRSGGAFRSDATSSTDGNGGRRAAAWRQGRCNLSGRATTPRSSLAFHAAAAARPSRRL